MSQTRQVAVAETIERFVRERFHVTPGDARFTRQAHLWEEGYVDSIGIVEMIAFLESTFAVQIPEQALFSPDFTHIDGMARVIVELGAVPDLTRP
jgi:acyl carrier protein